jgi:N-acetyl-D-muramate 6-phosphate phosphatase
MSQLVSKGSVLFDLDGTLMDTAPDFVETLKLLRARYQMPELDSVLVRNNVSDGSRALTRICFPDLSESSNQDFSEDSEFERRRLELLDIYAAVVGSNVTFFPEIRNALDVIEQKGVRWGIVTNKPRLYTELLLERTGLGQKCAVLICADDLKRSKPDPEGILNACQQLGCEPAYSLYVGDHERDIQAGKAAGCKTVAVTFGYIDDPSIAESWGADFIMRTASDLILLLD